MLGVDLVLVNPGLSGSLIARVAAQEGLTLVVHDDDVDLSATDLPPAIIRLRQSTLRARSTERPPVRRSSHRSGGGG